MLERILDPESAGSVTITFEKAGVVCVFELDLGAPTKLSTFFPEPRAAGPSFKGSRADVVGPIAVGST
jgi:hypothetical protein